MSVIITGSNTPTAGGVIYGDGSTYAATAAGSSGQVLTSAGTSAPTWATVSAGFTLGTPVNTTSGTSVTFTGIPSTAKVVYLNFVNFSLATSDTVRVRLGTSSGVETTDYYLMRNAASGSGNSTTSTSAGISFPFNAGGLYIYNGTYTFVLENSTTNTWTTTFNIGGDSNIMSTLSGSKSLTSQLSQIEISTGTATFAAGQVNIAYI